MAENKSYLDILGLKPPRTAVSQEVAKPPCGEPINLITRRGIRGSFGVVRFVRRCARCKARQDQEAARRSKHQRLEGGNRFVVSGC